MTAPSLYWLRNDLRLTDNAALTAAAATETLAREITPADRDHIASTVRRAYRLLGAEASLDYVLHPGGHFLAWEMAAPFLAQHLQASPRG